MFYYYSAYKTKMDKTAIQFSRLRAHYPLSSRNVLQGNLFTWREGSPANQDQDTLGEPAFHTFL